MTQEQVRPLPGRRRAAKQYLILAIVVAVILAAVGAVSYYGEEIQVFFSLGGWNRGAASQVVRQFVEHVQAGRIPDAVALVDPQAYKTIEEGNKVVGLEHRDESGRGRYRVRFDNLIPPGAAELKNVTLTASDGGGFVVPIRFADGTEGWFVVARRGNDHRIVSVPTVPGRFDY